MILMIIMKWWNINDIININNNVCNININIIIIINV